MCYFKNGPFKDLLLLELKLPMTRSVPLSVGCSVCHAVELWLILKKKFKCWHVPTFTYLLPPFWSDLAKLWIHNMCMKIFYGWKFPDRPETIIYLPQVSHCQFLQMQTWMRTEYARLVKTHVNIGIGTSQKYENKVCENI